ncbi:hypothetical protein Tco_0369601 [Tanacetum coccineum]
MTVLCTTLSKKVEGLESELKQTKQTYSSALTKLILRVKKLEKIVKTTKARRRARLVISEEEDAAKDSSKQERKISKIDEDPTISLVQDEEMTWFQEDAEIQEKNSADPEILLQEEEPTELVEDIGSGEKGEKEVTTAKNFQTYIKKRSQVSTCSGDVSTASRLDSTADVSTASELGGTAGIKAKDKGKTIMQESEPPKKIKRRVQVQISADEELAKKVFEEEQARFNVEQEAMFKAEQEQERIDFETALKLQKQLDDREEVVAKDDQAHVINWNDHSVIRFYAQQNRSFSKAEVRKNMCMYLKNQGGYKMSYFKGMSYEDIRPVFEKVWDQVNAFVPKDSELENEVMKRPRINLQQESSKKVEEEIIQQEDVVAEQVVIKSSRKARGRRKKSLARKRARETLSEESAKKQKLEDDTEELQVYLNIIPEDKSLNVESLATKYLIVDWETQILANDKYYYQIKRVDGSVKHYKIFSAMLYDFDRQDVLELYRLVKERFQTASPEGYDLLL